VPRQDTVEFTVRNGQRVNGMRSVGLTSKRLNPKSFALTPSFVVLR
jgi:hypothetical protein